MDLRQLHEALDRHDGRDRPRTPQVLAPGAVRLVDPRSLKRLDDHREPRKSYDELFEPVD